MRPACLRISQRSVLVINAPKAEIRDLVLDGTLLVDAAPEAEVLIDGLHVENKGWRWMALKPDKPMTEEMAIRCGPRAWPVLGGLTGCWGVGMWEWGRFAVESQATNWV